MATRAAVLGEGGGNPPTLAIVEAVADPAAASYLRQIERAFGRRGLAVRRQSPASPDAASVRALLAGYASDDTVQGILVTQPLPCGVSLDDVLTALPPEKDVEGIHPWNAGLLAQGRPAVVPSTPKAGMELLAAAGIELRGKVAVIVGRSPIVGRPLSQLLLLESATVVVCHTGTIDLASWTRRAEILCVAAGRPGLIDGPMVGPGATVIDFGINEVGGALVGDVDAASVAAVAGALTPVPGGVGPVTTAVLARNLVELAERRR